MERSSTAAPRTPGDADAISDSIAAEGRTMEPGRAASASPSPLTRSQAETVTLRPLPDDDANGTDDHDNREAPEQAGERLASHLDMLAETVRAIVTRVMQPPPGDGDGGTQRNADDNNHDEAVAVVATRAPAVMPTVNATGGRTEYSLEVREQCVAKHAAGASYKTIATEMNMPMTTVQTIVKRAKQQGGVVTVAQRAGRPRVTDERVETTIRAIVATQPQLSAREVLDQVMLAHEGIAVSFETIRRRVRDCRKQLNNEADGSGGNGGRREGPSPSAAVATVDARVPLENQLHARFLEHQQQQAQLGETDDSNDVDMDADLYSDDDGDATPMRADPLTGSTSDTEAEASTGSAPVTTPAKRTAGSGKTRRKRGSEYSPEFREMCVQKHERDGKSYQAIATELDIPPDSVRAIVRKAKRTGTVVTAPRSGRPRKTTDLIDRVILQSVKNSQRSTAKQIQDDLWSIYQVKVSCETIRRRVRDHTKQRLQVADSTAVRPDATAVIAEAAAVPTAILPLAASALNSAAPPHVVDERIRGDATSGASSSSPSTSRSTEDEPTPPPTTRSLKRKRTEYPIDVREKCVALHTEGLGFRKIGEQLNMPHTTVRAIVEKVQRTGSMLPAPRSGRPRKTDEILDKVILQTVKANAKCSARMIQQELETAFDVKVSCETIRRRVKDYMRQKHLFAESSPLTLDASEDEAVEAPAVGDRSTPSAAQRTPASGLTPMVGTIDAPTAVAAMLAEQLELQRQHQQAEEQQRQEREREQHESMLLMAEITQPFHNVHPHDALVAATNDVRAVPPSLVEMMTAAAAAAAAVSNHHQPHGSHLHAHAHLAYQLPLMPVPYGYGFAHQLHQPHAQAMQAMLDEALAAPPLEATHHLHAQQQHQQHQQQHHQQQQLQHQQQQLHHLQQQQPLPPPQHQQPPPSPSSMSDFVML